MICPHCKTNIGWAVVLDALHKELDRHAEPVATITERSDLMVWLEQWRSERGLPLINLKGRSTPQLRKMRSEALNGGGYRLGRKWKVGH